MPTMSSTITLPPLSQDLVLSVYYQIWEAAVHALPVYRPTRIGRVRDDLPGINSISGGVWLFVRDMSKPRQFQRPLPDAQDHLHRSLVMKDLCEIFCLLLGSEVEKKLRGN